MKSKLIKYTAVVGLLSAAVSAYAASGCCDSLECCLQMLACCF